MASSEESNQPEIPDIEDAPVQGNEFSRIMKIYKRKWTFILAIFFSMCSGIAPQLMNVFFGDLLNAVSKPNFSKKDLNGAIINLMIITVVVIALLVINHAFRSQTNPEFMHDLREAIYSHILRMDISFFDKTSTGVLISRLSQDATLLFNIYIDKILTVALSITQAAGGLILSYITMWQVALPATVFVILCTVSYYIGDRVVTKLWEEFAQHSSKATSKAEEVITSFRTIRSFDNEMYETQQYGKVLDDVDAIFSKTSIAQGLKDSVILFFTNLMLPVFIGLGSYFIVEKPEMGYVSGDLVILLLSLLFATTGFTIVLSLSDDFKKARASAAKILKLLDLEPEVDQEKSGKKLKKDFVFQGKVEFRDVGFKYKTRDEWAVRHLSFTVEPGETVALIGESGCGKSTTLQLLQRFYEISEGQILIDDMDISKINPQDLRSMISVVPQGPVLFSMSIKDNIRYANPRATEEEVHKCAEIGNAHDFIMEMPDNYASRVQQTSLSGGQKQRICISRAILANTPILLLDEATAALDTESEQLVQQSLENFRKGKTAILVAHRLATVINADRIIVYKDGHVEEVGTHQELMEKGGLYSELVKFQLQ
ncbi:ABC transporter family protein [Tritrichomonas foetus]|uniref:ABC transporter family protein n=1 Tax=Tritrichomonas foetus TaxID=1144522 RepID=A0A1J4KFX4_9EUKA|nr:ABC transporter family protein [Tritrichomonas foetus]|eukprot:OHT10311.1 ABC transporter family protein [Tritrichomonas foetus]